jgi:hypothetical protein
MFRISQLCKILFILTVQIMKVIKDLPYYLLAFVFLVFGLNGFLNFIPLPPPEGDSAVFLVFCFRQGTLKLSKQ